MKVINKMKQHKTHTFVCSVDLSGAKRNQGETLVPEILKIRRSLRAQTNA
ncbi:hypothetical protein HanXRQr2_Chr08g0360711 [Helianthus annuus]|uniref:Uncharacterized protein n=1 Tax=Helianthus annuus TaxID=4232 RepID=A0A9K3IHW3_HELAN|nr:hypothetical protein HanXRQr2_Chr08g0360711 [Helianthus annuus]KAJ0903342.1 hypothetical protein HanPSC8_Chr08g0347981 [Helianthus annuus]